METIRSEELYHYGRKGMKWGMNIFGKVSAKKTARKKSENLKKAREAKLKRQRDEAERKDKIARDKLSPKKMTDKEMQDRIARLELEKKYKDAVKDSRSAQSRGKRFVEKFLDSTTDKVAENAAADIVAQAVKVVVTNGTNKMFKALGEETDVVFTNNKKK